MENEEKMEEVEAVEEVEEVEEVASETEAEQTETADAVVDEAEAEEPTAEAEVAAEEADAEQTAEETAPEEVFRKKIIVVDDVYLHLTSIKNRLQSHYEIYPAQGAQILFNLLEKFLPDLILLDINMPDIDGYGVLEMLKMNVRFADIPVIFLTSSTDRASVMKGLNLGAADYVVKPFQDEKLIESIEKQLNPEGGEKEKPIVLTVDDTPAILQSVYNALNEQYKVYTLPKPEKLPDLLKMVCPDLFLLDYNMPVLNGFELVPIIRATPGHEKTPIIFLTTEGYVGHISEAIRLGACDFILKPASEELLRQKVGAHIGC